MENFKNFLSDKERKELRGFLNRRDFSGREHGRASAILHLDKGKSVPQVAEITFLDEQTIRNFVERYKSGGSNGLLKDEYDGRSFKLTSEQRKELERHLDENLYMDCQGVINHVSVSHTASAACVFFCILWASSTRSPSMFPARPTVRRRPISPDAFMN